MSRSPFKKRVMIGTATPDSAESAVADLPLVSMARLSCADMLAMEVYYPLVTLRQGCECRESVNSPPVVARPNCRCEFRLLSLFARHITW
jgi:hypothetical protein